MNWSCVTRHKKQQIFIMFIEIEVIDYECLLERFLYYTRVQPNGSLKPIDLIISRCVKFTV